LLTVKDILEKSGNLISIRYNIATGV